MTNVAVIGDGQMGLETSSLRLSFGEKDAPPEGPWTAPSFWMMTASSGPPIALLYRENLAKPGAQTAGRKT